MRIECPECLAEIDAPDDLMVGEVLECPDCGVELEVYRVGDDGVKVRVSESLDEDWGE